MKSRGLTLMEVLIVVMIFAILVVLIVASARTAVLRSKNTKIASDLAEARKLAERIFMGATDGYVSLCATPPGGDFNSANFSWPALVHIQQGISESGGRVYCYADSDSYCVNVRLTEANNYLCIDSVGRFATDVSATQLCANANSFCP